MIQGLKHTCECCTILLSMEHLHPSSSARHVILGFTLSISVIKYTNTYLNSSLVCRMTLDVDALGDGDLEDLDMVNGF